MSTAIKRRRGTAAEHSSFAGLEGELTVNTTNDSVHVHDGTTAGGFELARADGSNVSTFALGDNDKVTFGAGSDLQIYHDGTHSRVNNNTGDLFLQSPTVVRITNSTASETAAKFFEDGAVELYHDNSRKIRTTSTGIDVTGTVVSDGLDSTVGSIRLDGNFPVGTSNTALGRYALDDGVFSGTANVALGYATLSENETGSYNTAVGSSALYANTTASNNTAVGYQAGYSNTTGPRNSSFGMAALYSNTTGSDNTAFGQGALYYNTTASDSTMIGAGAGFYSTGASNTFVGKDSGVTVTTGSKNTILGRYNGNQGGLDIRTSSNNIVLSDGDGNPRLVCNSNGNWGIGGAGSAGHRLYAKGGTSDGSATAPTSALYTSCSTTSTENHRCAQFIYTHGFYDYYYGHRGIVVRNYDDNTSRSAKAMYMLGSTGSVVGSIGFNDNGTSFNTTSDYRLKENVVPLENATERLLSLKPSRFNFIGKEETVDGFIAHEAAEVVPEAVTGDKDDVMRDEDGNIKLDENGNEQPIYQGIDQSKLVPLLVATIQELEARIKALESA